MRRLPIAAVGCLALMVLSCSAGGEEMGQAGGGPQAEAPAGRAELLSDIEKARAGHLSDPNNVESRKELAELSYEAGRFGDVRGLLEPLLDAEPDVDVLTLAAKTEYLFGAYERTEELLLRVLEREPDNVSARRKLVFVYYQMNRYDECASIATEALSDRPMPHLDLMNSFGDDEPYRVSWQGKDRTTVPFLLTDPLPLIKVEIQGREVTALIDTGGDTFILDPEIGASLGIEIVASMMGMFAGGMEAEVGFGRADYLRLGDVTLHSVPIALLPTGGMELGGHRIEGIVGTQVLKQFQSTLDYPNDRLILRARDGESAAAFRSGATALGEVPFYLQSTHFLLAEGSLNGRSGLMFHVDSGLAGAAAFAAPEQTLDYIGIPVPEVEVHEGTMGGGGGGFALGSFEIDRLGLGGLEQGDLVGSFGALPPQSYRMLGFIQDGLISHNFLKAYAWTLDFDSMTMVFTQ